MRGMIDKELIAMCNCPEIQDRWEPKVGDRYMVHLNGSIHVIDYHTMKQVEGEDFYRGLRTYIPRIEDVLEWLSGMVISLHGNGLSYVVTRDSMCEVADTPIKAILKAYMNLEHEKAWNGEAWA